MWEDSPGRSKRWCKLSQRVTRVLMGELYFYPLLLRPTRPEGVSTSLPLWTVPLQN